MILTVKNCKDSSFKSFVIDSVNYYLSEILSSAILKNIKVTIKFVSKTKDYGSTLVTGKNKSNKAREFLVEIKKNMNARVTLETLAHEMVHVKQFALGELNETVEKWKGEKINKDKIDYHFYPWEIEANGISYGLFFKYCVRYELWDIFNDIENPFEFYQQKNIWKT